MSMQRIYLDHNATTPLRPDVAEAMAGALREELGNPSSVHAEGAAARARVEMARSRIAAFLQAPEASIRFTSGATESNNTVLLGLLEPGDHVVTTLVEHPSVLAPLAWLEERGVEVTRLSPGSDGCVDAATVAAALEARTKLVSMIWANNETGAIQPIPEVAALCAARGIALHVDATQAVSRIPVDLSRVPIDFLSASAHKLGGPKGVGALVSRRPQEAPVWLRGGAQERGRRGGTENVLGIVGFGVACAQAERDMGERIERHAKLRDRLWQGIRTGIEDVRWNGDPDRTLPNTLNVEFRGVAGEVLLQALDLEGVSVSAGAACHSGSIEPSAVLLAMGRTREEARGSLRFSVGEGVDDGQIERVVALLRDLVPRIRRAEAP
ncbi:MAG: cysteine desulfurase family protein [bacterium]